MPSLYSRLARANYAKEHQACLVKQEENNMRTLKEWLQADDKKAIFLDQDETLLRIVMAKDVHRLGEWAEHNAIKTKVGGHDIGIVLRPGVLRFMIACNQLAPTYVLTAGVTQFQKKVLEAVRLADAVKDVYGRDRFHAVPHVPRAVLVDNLPYTSNNSQAKLQAMRGGVYVKVLDWHGIDPHDTALQEALVSIKKAFETSPEGSRQPARR